MNRKISLIKIVAAFALLSLAYTTMNASELELTSSDPKYFFSVGSFMGGGTITSQEKVKQSLGYGMGVERQFNLGQGLLNFTVGPRIEIANSFLSTKAEEQDTSFVANYDNRIFAGGLHIGKLLGDNASDRGLIREIYINGMAGKTFTKLTIDENEPRIYRQHRYHNISGDYFSQELGVLIPTRSGLFVNVAILNTTYKSMQKDAIGTYEESRVTDNPKGGFSLHSTEGVHADSRFLSNDKVFQKTLGLKLSVSLGL